MTDITLAQAKQNILNQIKGNKPIDVIKLAAEAYSVLVNAEYSEYSMWLQRQAIEQQAPPQGIPGMD